LGSYVFYWGQKQEFTPTWFSFFAENGDKTPLVDLMYELWGGRPGNRAPLIEDFAVDSWRDPDSLVLTAGRSYSVAVRAGDPDGDRLQFRWEILPDGPFFKYVPGRGKTEIRPRQLEKWIIRDEGARIVFRAPAHFGPFRLFVHVSDGRGNTSSVNLPFFVTDNNLTDE
jgi:hypothetical protein